MPSQWFTPHPCPAFDSLCLQDCILGRKTVGLIRGDIFVNGHPKQQETWSRVAGYVEQAVRGFLPSPHGCAVP